MAWRSAVASAPSERAGAEPKSGSRRSVSAASRPISQPVARYSKLSSSTLGAVAIDDEHHVDVVGRQVLADHRGAAADPEHVGRAHAAQLLQACREAGRTPVPPSAASAVRTSCDRRLEQAPHVRLALVARRGLADVATADAERRHAARITVQPAGGQQAGGQRQPEDRGERRIAQLGVDLVGDRLQGVQVARRVEVEQLVDQLAAAVEDREAVAKLLVVQALPDVGGGDLRGAGSGSTVEA